MAGPEQEEGASGLTGRALFPLCRAVVGEHEVGRVAGRIGVLAAKMRMAQSVGRCAGPWLVRQSYGAVAWVSAF